MRLALCTAAVLAVAVSSAAGAAVQPHVALTATSPVTVAGSGFGRQARVRVTLTALGRHIRAVTRANANGAFRVRLTPAFRITGCTAVTLLAQSPHRRATWKRHAGKGCGALSAPVTPLAGP